MTSPVRFSAVPLTHSKTIRASRTLINESSGERHDARDCCCRKAIGMVEKYWKTWTIGRFSGRVLCLLRNRKRFRFFRRVKARPSRCLSRGNALPLSSRLKHWHDER